MLTVDLSEQSMNLSCIKNGVPCDINASLSISPIRPPPPLFRPFTGCLVTASTGPVLRT